MVFLVLVGVLLFTAFCTLGVWQVERRAWKLDLIERVSQRLGAAPVELPLVSEWPKATRTALEYQPVVLQGRWLRQKALMAQAVTELGQGFWVMVPLQREDGTQVLVNRGFIPADQRARWETAQEEAAAPARVVGLIRWTEPAGGFLRRNDPAQQRWYSRDVAAMAEAAGLARAAPFFVDEGLPGSAPQVVGESGRSSSAQGTHALPRAGMTVVRFANSHLVYALTWFGLAAMVVGAGALMVRYERRVRAASRDNHAHEPQR